jgi:antitoxin (DNA-binding transcriptional repressor) of toxin-antitoxin stability system
MKLVALDVMARLPELLELVEQGRTIEITRRGETIAVLAPATPGPAQKSPPSISAGRRLVETS